MDDKLIKRSIMTSAFLCILALLMCLLALYFRWVEIAIVMAVLTLLQAYMICIWLGKKRRSKSHFRRNTPKHS